MKNSDAPRSTSRRSYTLGRQGFAKISAVEGIRLTHEMNEDFRDFERQRLTPAERRTVLSRKYGKRP